MPSTYCLPPRWPPPSGWCWWPGPLTYIGAVWAVISLVTSTIVLIRSRTRQHRIWATVTLAVAVVVLAVVVPPIVRPFV